MTRKLFLFLSTACAVGLVVYILFRQGFLPNSVNAVFSFSDNRAVAPNSFTLDNISYTRGYSLYDAQIHTKKDTVEAVTFVWIPYFHKHRDIDGALEAILTLADNTAFGKEKKKEYISFFSLLLADNEKLKQALEKKKSMFTPLVSEEIDRLLQAADSEAKAVSGQAVNHEKIWAEYAYTGNLDIIRNYIELLSPDKNISPSTRERIKDLVWEKSFIYYSVSQLVEEMVEDANGHLRVELFKFNKEIRDTIYKWFSHSYNSGKNYSIYENHEEAMTYFLGGVTFIQDHPQVLFSIGKLLASQNDHRNAILTYLQAIRLDEWSGNKIVLCYLAESYDKTGQSGLAVKALLRALAVDPDYVRAMVFLAGIYGRMGDHEKSIHYAHQIIKKGMRIEDIEYAETILKEYGADTSMFKAEMERVQRSDFRNLLVKDRFDRLERLLQDAVDERETDRNGRYTIYSKYAQLTGGASDSDRKFLELLPHYEKWLTADPDSHFANACFGMFYINYSLTDHAEGNRPVEGALLQRERIRLAAKFLFKAYEINPANGTVATQLITVIRLHPDYPSSEKEKWFQNAIAADPADPEPYEVRFKSIPLGVDGSIDERFAFAGETFRSAPKNSAAPKILAEAHWYVYEHNSDSDYFKRPEVWTEIKKVYSELIRRYPQSRDYRNRFAGTACLAEDVQTLREQLGFIEDDWEVQVWKRRNNFERCKNLAFPGKDPL